jgi:hypothetical protein
MKQDSAVGGILDTAGQIRSQHIDPEVDDELVVRVYEFTLAYETATLSQVVTALRIPVADVKQAVDLLRDLRLLRCSETFDSFRAVCPEAAQNELVIPLQQAVNDKRRELAGVHQRLHTLSSIFSTLRRPPTARIGLTSHHPASGAVGAVRIRGSRRRTARNG